MPPPAEEFAALLADAMRGQPYDVGARPRPTAGQRAALRARRPADRPPPRSARSDRRLCRALPKGRSLPLPGPRQARVRASARRVSRVASWSFSGWAGLAATRLPTRPTSTSSISTRPAGGGASDGAKPLGPNDYFNRLASRVTAALSVPTASGPLYEVDTRLRPEGAKGMLTVSLDAFERYQREQAWTWEHMALCRARPVFGSDAASAEARADMIDEHPANAARSRRRSRAMPPGCGPRSSATSRRRARST